MLVAKDYRERAWNALSNNWSTAICTYLVYAIVMAVLTTTFSFLAGLPCLVLFGPIYYGLSTQYLKIVRGEKPFVEDLMAARNRFTETFLAALINGIYIFLWSLLLIVPGIIKAISYSMTYYILRDNPNMHADEARRESARIMEGNKWSLFCLYVSFIGWLLLCGLTFGILLLWVRPYMECAKAEFYDCLLPPRATVEHLGETTETQSDSIDPFANDEQPIDPFAPDEPFYVFEEEMPKSSDDDNPNSNISGR